MEQNKNFFKFNKENFSFSQVKDSIAEFFFAHSELLFMMFFMIMTVFSSFLIYKYIFSSTWSIEKKEAYLQELKKGEVEFKLNDFELIVEKSKEREAIYNKDIVKENVRDVFGVE